MCVCVCMYMQGDKRMYMCVQECVHSHTCMYEHACMHILYVYVCTYVHMSIWVCIHMCTAWTHVCACGIELCALTLLYSNLAHHQKRKCKPRLPCTAAAGCGVTVLMVPLINLVAEAAIANLQRHRRGSGWVKAFHFSLRLMQRCSTKMHFPLCLCFAQRQTNPKSHIFRQQ